MALRARRRLLDLACGNGNMRSPPHRGAVVTAIDLTPQLIALAKPRDG
jgi:2-polyprenyl-3-methyl-5-hydroxy-6-metoxy-1,4-benzoquinol methylase